MKRTFSTGNHNWADRVLGYLMDFGPFLFLNLTYDSEKKWLRVMGILATFPWFWITCPIIMIPAVVLLAIDIISEC